MKLEIWQIHKFIVETKQNNVTFDTEKDIKGLRMFKKAFVRMSLILWGRCHRIEAVFPGGGGTPHSCSWTFPLLFLPDKGSDPQVPFYRTESEDIPESQALAPALSVAVA